MKNLFRCYTFALIVCSFSTFLLSAQTPDVWLRHAVTYDSYGRDNGNDPDWLKQASLYCDSVIYSETSSAEQKNKANRLKKRIGITLQTCENNLNYKIEFYQFFLGKPASYGFANDPEEYAFGNAFNKILGFTYTGFGSTPISEFNIPCILLDGNCGEVLSETNMQTLAAKTKHVLISKQDVYDILGNKTDTLYIGDPDTSSLNAICASLGIDRLGIYEISKLDSVNNLRFVSVSFRIYSPKSGMGTMAYADAFGEDKRKGQLDIILYLIISSVLLITLLAVFEELYDRKKSKTWHLVSFKSVWALFLSKLKLVSISQVLPTILSFLIVTFINPLAPEMSTHYQETESLLWVFALTFSMSLVPTIINLLIVNRLDLDGFHTPRGYQNFANASVYGSYFTFFYFFALKYQHIAHTQHLMLIGVTFIIGLILGKSIFLLLNKRNFKPLLIAGVLGVMLTLLLLVAVNIIILASFQWQGFALALGTCIVAALGYFIFEGNQLRISKNQLILKNNTLNPDAITYVPEAINIKGSEFSLSITAGENRGNIPIYVISGPAGIGKTAFIRKYLFLKWKEVFDEDNWFYSDCNEIQESNEISFEPFVEAFGKLLGRETLDDRGDLLGTQMEKIIKNTAGAINENAAELLTHKKRDDIRSISEYCTQIAEELEKRNKPCVFILEDIQWIDQESRNFLFRFLKVLSNKKHFPNVNRNLKLLFTIRSGDWFDSKGLKPDELAEYLANYESTYDISNISDKDLFTFNQFIYNFGVRNPGFRLSDSSCNLMEDLLKQREAEIKSSNPNTTFGLTPLYLVKLLSGWIEEGTLKASNGGLVLTRQLTTEDLPNNEEIDQFYHAIFDKIPSTPTTDRLQWVRILESAAIIGQKFDATILASVWGIDLLQLLDFLERMEILELVEDVPGQDNIYQFVSPRVSAALKTYFGRKSASEEKQIVLEYNKRWFLSQSQGLLPCSDLDIEKLNIITKRLYTLRNIREYENHYRHCLSILSLRYCLVGDFEKLNLLITNMDPDYSGWFYQSILSYRDFLESGISHEYINVPVSENSESELFWYLELFNSIISGLIEGEDLKNKLQKISEAKEYVFLEFFLRLIESNEYLIQQQNTALLAFTDELLKKSGYFRSEFITLLNLLKFKLISNPYCDKDVEEKEILEDLIKMQKSFTNQTSAFIRYEFHVLKMSMLSALDDAKGQVDAFQYALHDLKSGDKINAYWVNFVLKNTGYSIFNQSDIDFEVIFNQIRQYLEIRGLLDEINEMNVTFRGEYFRFKTNKHNKVNKASIEEDAIQSYVSDLHSFVQDIDNDTLLSNRMKLSFKLRILRVYHEYINDKDYEKALKNGLECLEIAHVLGDLASKISILISLARICRNMKNYDEAISYNRNVLAEIAHLHNIEPFKKGLAHYQFGVTLMGSGSYETAVEQFKIANGFWSDNEKGKVRTMITDLQILQCVLDGKLQSEKIFNDSVQNVLERIAVFENHPYLIGLYSDFPNKVKSLRAKIQLLL
jgi:hypothetical protein